MARKYFCGFETGDFSECSGVTGSPAPTIQSSIVRSGAYALKVPDGASHAGSTLAIVNATTVYARFYFLFDANPTGGPLFFTFEDTTSPGSWLMSLGISAGTNTLYALDPSFSGIGTGGTTALVANTWYLIEAKAVIGAGTGSLEVKINGTVEAGVSATGLTNNGSGNIGHIGFLNSTGSGAGTAGCNVYIDDVAVDDAAYPGPGKVIARQFKSGTPTYNSWTKTGGSGTIDSVWDDTPFSATKFAVTASQTAAVAQTGLTASFSATQTGHGTDTIGASDTINAIKIGGIAKCSSTANSRNLGSIRSRFNSVDTDTNVTMTTADAYYETAIFTDTLAHLNAAEAGWNKRASTTAGTQTVEDMWVIVDYTPGAISISLAGNAATGSAGSLAAKAVLPSFTGVAATSAAGSLGIADKPVLAGVQAAGSAGTLAETASASPALTGVTAAAAAGALAIVDAKTLTGVAASGLLGTLAETSSPSPTLLGLAAAGSAGLLSETATASPSITGVAATGTAGVVSSSSATVVSTLGVFASGSAGLLGLKVSVTPAGVSASGSGGMLASNLIPLLSGVSATAAAGSLAKIIAEGLIGVSATGSAGLISFAGQVNASPVGVAAAGIAGTLLAKISASFTVAGVSANGAVGTLTGKDITSLAGAAAQGFAGALLGAIAFPNLGVQGDASAGSFNLNRNGGATAFGVFASGLAGIIRFGEPNAPRTDRSSRSSFANNEGDARAGAISMDYRAPQDSKDHRGRQDSTARRTSPFSTGDRRTPD